MNKNQWTALEPFGEYSDLEKYLEEIMVPVAPRPRFVTDLRRRLIKAFDEIEPETKNGVNPEVLRYSVIAGAGVLSSVLILITSIRAIKTLAGTIGALRRTKTPIDQNSPAPVTAALTQS